MRSRNHNSLYNALAALGTTLVNGLLGIVVTKLVIAHFGSDFNGLNSTANQIVNILLVLEGGFLWRKPGYVLQKEQTLIAQCASGEKTVYITGKPAEDDP